MASRQKQDMGAQRGNDGIGTLLRDWRMRRGKSQLALSLDANISQRHLSYIECGRSRPGRDTVIGLADVLDVPLRDRNRLLLAAGYAPVYRDGDWNEPEMRSIAAAIGRMLRQQDPYPAVLMDRGWTVLEANRSALSFFDRFVDLAGRPKPRNLLHLLFDPAGLRPHIKDWEQLATSLLSRVRRESFGAASEVRTQALITSLLAYPDVPRWPAATVSGDVLPMIPIVLQYRGTVLRYFSMLCTVGAPASVAAQELRLECLFPADPETEHAHLALMAQPDLRP